MLTLPWRPDVYVILGGGLTVSGSGSLTGDTAGVFIFNAGSTYNGTTDGGAYGAITLGGSGSLSLKPMSSGTYAGILIFQSRSNSKVLSLSGAASLSTTGVIYAPLAQLAISGSGTLHDTLVVNSLYVSGSAGAFQLSDGATSGYQVSTFNMLTNPIITVAVQDDTGSGLDPAEVDELTASMNYLNAALSQFGVSVTLGRERGRGRRPGPLRGDHSAGRVQRRRPRVYHGGQRSVLRGRVEHVHRRRIRPGSAANQFDFQTLATHELAHALGLGESADPNSVMYEYLAPGMVRRGFTDTNLALINTDADRFMKVVEPVTTRSAASGSPAALGVGLPALGLDDPTAGSMINRLLIQGGPVAGGGGDDPHLREVVPDRLIGEIDGDRGDTDSNNTNDTGMLGLDERLSVGSDACHDSL